MSAQWCLQEKLRGLAFEPSTGQAASDLHPGGPGLLHVWYLAGLSWLAALSWISIYMYTHYCASPESGALSVPPDCG